MGVDEIMTRLGFHGPGDLWTSNGPSQGVARGAQAGGMGPGRRQDSPGESGGGNGYFSNAGYGSKCRQLTHIDVAAVLNEFTEPGAHAGVGAAGHGGAVSPGRWGVETEAREATVATPEGAVAAYPAESIGWGLDT